jgi:hypothetical protein
VVEASRREPDEAEERAAEERERPGLGDQRAAGTAPDQRRVGDTTDPDLKDILDLLVAALDQGHTGGEARAVRGSAVGS